MHAASRSECPSRSCSGFLQRTRQQPLDQYAGLCHQQRSAHTTFCFPSCQQRCCTSVADSCVYCAADWDNASLSNESLLDTVSRFVLAALLKHTGLLGQGCGEGRYCCRTLMRCSTEQQPKFKHVTLFFFLSDTSHQSPWRRFIAVSIRCGTACWPARTWTSSRLDRPRVSGG